MVIRAKYQWILLSNFACFSASAAFIIGVRPDHFLGYFDAGMAAFSLVAWLTIYTKLDGGMLTKRIFLLPYRSFPVDTIERIQPHRKNGKWSYGTVIEVWSASGQKLTLQPNRPQQFLELLRHQAPKAAYLL